MALTLPQPRHLARYRDLIALVLKYGRSDLIARARLEEILSEELPPGDHDGSAGPETFVSDLERLGPTFVKLGQLLSTRPDLLPEPYLLALSRLHDDVAPVPFVEIEATVRAELGVRLSKAFPRSARNPSPPPPLGQCTHAA